MKTFARRGLVGNRFPVRAATAWRLAAGMAIAALSLASCGGGDDRLLFSADIPSNRAVDGFVTRTVPIGTDNVFLAQDNGAVQAGTDPLTLSESRAFLDFPLDGAGGVPAGARIESAVLHAFVSRIDAASGFRFPLVLEIVPVFAPLDPSDFGATADPAVSVIFEFSPTRDNGNFVSIDVTPLLRKAIADGSRRLELRVRPGVSAAGPGLAVIEDAGIFDTAPRLQADYFLN